MRINLMIKSSGRTRGVESHPYVIKDDIATLADLIVNLVDIEIDRYENDELRVMSQEDLDEMLYRGKVSFGFKYRENNNIDRTHAKTVALQAFKDGLFAVFIGDKQAELLEAPLHLEENDNLSLIRFTMMTGRYY